ncbi:hypothetical protein ASG25_08020 [Rhizobium sp. Leaf384]|uniref:hypothetical protein n=1 Tax=unclassified Rhizobium TaxID=2613769 RepID=UPI0007141679|nr:MULTISPECIES: hypothetical protein [unclassified Rhizobium]KQR78175.1 hypothetical protein ASG03_17885 [Rhizobium sp. Leaf341]KQS81387.1 hypothetical protein ASG25_08020 [Rhizobium sp. Leaf384]KQS87297.1 hypothetical protein ASG58_03580 [Rhizobium sp. Leaf383]
MAILFRLASCLALIAAIVAGTVDAIRSVAETAVVMTPLGIAVASISPYWLEVVEALERPDGSLAVFQPVLRWCLQQPAFAVFLGLSLVLWMGGYRRARKRRLA